MKQSVLASLALLGTSALASAVGSAVVLNQCPFDVYLFNVPSANGGFDEQDSIIPSGGSWTQVWTQLTNGNGWAIKLSKSTDLTSILQYEYTFHNDENIWYDLSAVNGDPWSGDWSLVANGFNCTPKYAAYQYPTDDVHAMQHCDQEASITAIVCASESQASAVVPSTSSATMSETASSLLGISTPSVTIPAITSEISAPSVTIPAITLGSSTPSTTSTPASSSASSSVTSSAFPLQYSSHSHHTYVQAAVENSSTSTSTLPTTFATSTTVPVEEAPGVTVWEVETAVVTAVVTAIYTEPPSRIKRHEHHAGHQHAI